MSEEKHSWIASQRGTAKRGQWKAPAARRRLLSRLAGSARKYAETIELDQIRRSTDADKDTREGMTAGVKYLLRSLERAMGMEDAMKKGPVVEELEDTLGVQDVEDLRELSESMSEGLATITETHAQLREKTRNRGYQPSSSASSHAAFGKHAPLSGTGRGKGKTGPEGESVHQKKLVTRFADSHDLVATKELIVVGASYEASTARRDLRSAYSCGRIHCSSPCRIHSDSDSERVCGIRAIHLPSWTSTTKRYGWLF